MAVNITQIISPSPYDIKDNNLLQPSQVEALFDPSIDYIEYVITTPNKSFKNVDYNYNNYTFPTNGTVTSNAISNIDIDPISDINRKGYNSGDFETYYNFYKTKLETSPSNRNIFIKEISANRTELKLNFSSTPSNASSILENFKQEASNNFSIYFEDFYLNFGEDNLIVANNFDYDPSNFDILINLYQPLPNNIQTNNTLWVVTKIADPLAFSISITPELVSPTIVTFDIKGPNFNIALADKVNNTTNYTDYSIIIIKYSYIFY
jgi:hypothetical protein